MSVVQYNRKDVIGNSLDGLPWATDVITSPEGISEHGIHWEPEMERYIENSILREKKTFRETMELLPEVIFHPEIKSERTNQSVDTIFRYRLLDVACWVKQPSYEGTHSAQPVDATDSAQSLFCESLQDWPRFIQGFQVNPPELRRQSATDIQDDGKPILDIISQCEKNVEYYGGVGNFARAAYYLLFLLKGDDRAVVPTSAFPKYRGASGAPSWQMRSTLHAALMLGPVYLLRTKRFDTKPYAEKLLLNFWAHFECRKPEVLRKCEVSLWAALFDAALGRDSVVSALKKAVETCKLYMLAENIVPGWLPLRITLGTDVLKADETCSTPNFDTSSSRESEGNTTPDRHGFELEGNSGEVLAAGLPRFPNALDPRDNPGRDGQGTPPKTPKCKNLDLPETLALTRPKRTRTDDAEVAPASSDKKMKRTKSKSKSWSSKWLKKIHLNAAELEELQSGPVRLKVKENATRLSFDEEDDMEIELDCHVTTWDVQTYDLATGAASSHRPWYPTLDRINLLKKLEDNCQKGHLNGKPAYFSDNGVSSICRMSYDVYKLKTAQELQNIFKTHHIAIYGKPDEKIGFDYHGLTSVLGPLTIPCTIQDQSMKVGDDMNEWAKMGCALDILNLVRSGQDSRALNCIDNNIAFDMAFDSKHRLTTCQRAWIDSKGLQFCRKDRYPTDKTHFALCATDGCVSYIHMDPNGFASVIEVLAGMKEWFVGTATQPHGFSSTSTYLEGYGIKDLNSDRFRWEKIALDPTTIFIQRPATPYIVFTPTPTLLRGFFFYSSSTIRSSVFGFYHTNLMSEGSNTNLSETGVWLLSRIMAMWHTCLVEGNAITDYVQMPKFDTFDGVFDVMALCAFFEISGLVAPFNYGDQRLHRNRLIACRKRGRDVIEWLDAHYKFLQDGEEVGLKEGLYWPYVARVAWIYQSYNNQAERLRISRSKPHGLTLDRVLEVFNVAPLIGLREIYKGLREAGSQGPRTFDWVGSGVEVLPLEEPKDITIEHDGFDGDDVAHGVDRKLFLWDK